MGWAVTWEAVEEPFQVLVQQRVPLDLHVGELLQLSGSEAVDQQIADLDEVDFSASCSMG